MRPEGSELGPAPRPRARACAVAHLAAGDSSLLGKGDGAGPMMGGELRLGGGGSEHWCLPEMLWALGEEEESLAFALAILPRPHQTRNVGNGAGEESSRRVCISVCVCVCM